MSEFAKAPADGYTLGVGAAGALAANASLYAQMPFDVAKDFRPVTEPIGKGLELDFKSLH